MYGRRAAVIEADPASFAVQPYLFSMVVSEDAQAAGFGATRSRWPAPGPVAPLRRRGLAGWYPRFAAGVEPGAGKPTSIKSRWKSNPSTCSRARRTADRRRSVDPSAPRPGQHAGVAGATVRLPLGVLWFGGPNNHNILPRHSGGPRPHVVAGRQVYLGVETIGARCVYTGRQLWVRDFPKIGHSFTNLELEEQWRDGKEVYMTNIPGATYIGSPFVTLSDAIYLRHEGRIHRLPRTPARRSPSSPYRAVRWPNCTATACPIGGTSACRAISDHHQ
jgi:hypothetical protein